MSFEDRLDAAAAASDAELFDAAVAALGYSPTYAYSPVLYALLPRLTD